MADLTQAARQVLAELELTMHGKVSSWNSSGGGRGENPNPFPQGESSPPHLTWRLRFQEANPDALQAMVEEAREELKAIRGYGRAAVPKPAGETREEWEQRLLVEGEGFEARDVAVRFSCGVRDVTRIRRLARRDPNTGKVDLVVLAARGLTERQMAVEAGMSKTSLRRALGRDEKAA